jgi:multidrug resistance efflux pump
MRGCIRRHLAGLVPFGGFPSIAGSLLLALIMSPAHAQTRSPFTASGTVEPEGGILSIGTAATGVVERLGVMPGDHVRAGQELFAIDCAPLDADLRQLAAQAAAAKAVDERVRNGSRLAEIAVGEANLGVARARAEEAGEALRRAQALQVGISVTQAALLQVQRDARISSAQVEDAQAKLDLLRSGSRDEDIAEADARRDAAAAAFEEARAKLAQCRVASPVDGVVVSRPVSVGQFVSSAVPVTLLRLVRDGAFRVRAEVDEAHIADLCAQQRVAVSLPGAGSPLAGAVSRIIPLVGEMPHPAGRAGEGPERGVEVMVRLDQQPPNLMAGEATTLRFEGCRP